MKSNSLFVQIVSMFQDLAFHLLNTAEKMIPRKKKTPSYIALNINWFTNCTWIEQLQAFKQLDLYLDKGKRVC